MRFDRKKYCHIVAILSIVYLNFYFFAPYIHVHSDEASIIVASSVLHSHLPGQSGSDHDGIGPSDNNGHIHHLSISVFSTIISSRYISSVVELSFFEVSPYLISKEKHITQTIIPQERSVAASLEKYVHSASNSSPPQA